MNLRIFRGINKKGDMEAVDADSFRFHVPMKGMFYRLLNFINPPPKEWVDDIRGNMGVLRDIYREYEANEKQEWRRDVLTKVFPFTLCLSAYDENYEEVMQWFVYRIIQEQHRFKFDQEHTDPYFWFQDGRGRIGMTKQDQATVSDLEDKHGEEE